MSTPTPSPVATQPQPENPAVPLAVWPLARRSTAAPAGSSPLLDRLIAEYAPADPCVLLCTPARPRHEMQITAFSAADRTTHDGTDSRDGEAGTGLLVGLLHARSPRSKELTLLADVAARILRTGGLLAIITRSRPSRLRPHQDQVSRSVHAAAAAGFGYVQHVIVVDPGQPSGGSENQLDAGYDADRDAAILHRTAHLDVTIFRRPAVPAAAKPVATGGGE